MSGPRVPPRSIAFAAASLLLSLACFAVSITTPRSTFARPDRGQRALAGASSGADPAAVTQVGGEITSDTTWQGDILVTSYVLVKPGVTLTVQPGAHVRFKHYRGYREPELRLGMQVEGTLSAIGTAAQPIYFTSDAADPQNGDWHMLRLINSANSVLRYCVVEFAQQGVNVWGGSPEISHSVVRWNNWEGVYFESYSQPTLSYCHLVENGYNGLAAEQFNTIDMDYCEIERSGTNGFHIDASTAHIRRSRVHDNQAHGLSVDDNGSLTADGVALYDNGCGIGIGEGTNTVTVSNLVFNNNTNGNYCGGTAQTHTSPYFAPSAIDVGFAPEMSYALGYIPGDPVLDGYMYVYPDQDETRHVVRKIGQGLGLTWSLGWDGTHLWTATLWGDIYRLDPVTGAAQLQAYKAPGSQPWGMTFDRDGYLWIVDFAEKRISKLNPHTGQELATYPTPDPAGGCKGMTFDGTYLYVLGWTSPQIYRMTLQGQHVGTIPLDSGGGGGLAWDGQHFWVAASSRILEYDASGHLVGWIFGASEGTWDLAWDGQYLWATQRTNENWQDAKIYALQVLDDHSHLANPATLYVDAANPGPGSGSAADPYQGIQAAVDAALIGDRILVANGTYPGGVTVSKGVTLFGGYASYTSPVSWTRDIRAHESVLDGDGVGTVISFEDYSDGAVLDGFTVRHGSGSGAGGGVQADSASISIRNCLIKENFGTGADEWAGGGVLAYGGTVVISNTRIGGNFATMGAGGVRTADGELSLVNSLIGHNGGAWGIHSNNSVVRVTNCTVADNPAGGVLVSQGSSGMIVNSILWGNGAADVGLAPGGSADVRYSDVGVGVQSGEGNLHLEPGFSDPGSSDYGLRFDSPCIDAGLASAAPAFDIMGRERDAWPDMGAYEWVPARQYVPFVVKRR